MAEDFINHIADSSTPNAITLDEIKVHTRQDATLNKVIEVIRTGRWHDTANNESADIAAFRKVRDELTVGENGDFLLRDSRIVIPTALRSRVIQLAHEGHQGICKTKALIRSKVWFPGIDKETEAVVMGCIPCVANSNRRQMEPLNMTTLPRGPWINLSIDFCGPIPTGEYLLCVTDEYSRYPVVHVTRSTSAETVMPIMESIFAMFGYPETIKSDNGPPFQSNAWSQFLQSCGVRHRKITPLWPMANAQVENFNKPMMKAVRSAIIQHRNWRRELQQFLRNYRSTPHSSTLFTPHRLLFGREPRTKLPELPTLQSVHPEDEVVRRQDARAKARMKEYSDERAHASHVNLQMGEVVLVQQPRVNKLSTPFAPTPLIVSAMKGPMVTAVRGDGSTVTRNVSKFRRVRGLSPDEIARHHPEDTAADDDPPTDDESSETRHDDEEVLKPPALQAVRPQRARKKRQRLIEQI